MELSQPHKHIIVQSEKERFLVELFDDLWKRYRGRMEYVRKYEEIIQSYGAQFINDHIAFRTIARQEPTTGILTLSRIFEALGYIGAVCYEFPDQHFNSIHFQHPNPQFPKLFITQLKSWELSLPSQNIIQSSLRKHRPFFSDKSLTQLWNLSKLESKDRESLFTEVLRTFNELPWERPQKKDVLELNKESQFGAWVLINGYDVNHFTASVDSHGVSALDDIEKVVEAMVKAGIPMKPEIEGEKGTKLRQTSTQAAVIDSWVKDGERKVKIPWTYAYFEIAQRPLLPNPETGKLERFQGFLGGQASRLFDMTKLKN